jgi:hypothetical protein
MTIERACLVKWKTTASEEAIAAALRAVLALKDEIPGVIGIAAGKNESRFGDGFTHAFVVRFASREARDAYDAHGAHRRLVKQVFAPINEKIVVVDFDPEEYARSLT